MRIMSGKLFILASIGNPASGKRSRFRAGNQRLMCRLPSNHNEEQNGSFLILHSYHSQKSVAQSFENVQIYEDAPARGRKFLPLTYTRSVAELRSGAFTAIERVQALWSEARVY